MQTFSGHSLQSGIRANPFFGLLNKPNLYPKVKAGMLVFSNEAEFNVTFYYLASRNSDYLDSWESKIGFKSFRSAYNSIMRAEQLLLLKYREVIAVDSKSDRPAYSTLEYKQNKSTIYHSISSDGKLYLDRNLMFGAMGAILNSEGMVIIGGDVYHFTYDFVANLTKGYYRTLMGNSGVDNLNVKKNNDYLQDCECNDKNNSNPVYDFNLLPNNVEPGPENSNLINRGNSLNWKRSYYLPYTLGSSNLRTIQPILPATGPMSDYWELPCKVEGRVSLVYGWHRLRVTQRFTQYYDPNMGFYSTMILFTISHEGYTPLGSYGLVDANIFVDWYTWALQTPIIPTYDRFGNFLANLDIQFQPHTGGYKQWAFYGNNEITLNALLAFGTRSSKNNIPHTVPINDYNLTGLLPTDYMYSKIRPIIQGSNLIVTATKSHLGKSSTIKCEEYFHD